MFTLWLDDRVSDFPKNILICISNKQIAYLLCQLKALFSLNLHQFANFEYVFK